MNKKLAGIETGMGKMISQGLARAGNPISKSFRYLAGVKPGEAYASMSKPWQYSTRPLKTVMMPNFGPGGNVIRNGAIGYGVYEGGKEMHGRVQNARNEMVNMAKENLPGSAGEALSKSVMDKTTYPELAKATWRTLRGQYDTKDPLGATADALVAKTMQLGISGGLKDWGNSSYKGRDLLAGIWAPVAKKRMAGAAGGWLSNASTLKGEAEKMIASAVPQASQIENPTGATKAVTGLGNKVLGPKIMNRGKKYVASHAGEIGGKIEQELDNMIGSQSQRG